MRNKNEKIRIVAETAVMVALATILSLIKIYDAPYGGSVTLMSMLPIMILSCRRGTLCGLAGGFVYSVIELLLGLNNVAWVPTAGGIALCILFDYIIPFTLIGLCGMFFGGKDALSFNKASRAWRILVGAFVVMLLRYVCHIISGVAVWYALDLEWYADDPTHIVHKYGAWLFSAIYNGSFMLPEIAITLIGAAALCSVDAVFKTEKK